MTSGSGRSPAAGHGGSPLTRRPCALDGGDLRRHTDHDGFYARNASTDGSRIVYQCAGDLWLLESLDAAAEPRRLEISLGSPATRRAPRLISAEDHLGTLSCDHTGRASAIEVRGTVHWLTHRDGPARALSVVPGVRARQPQVLGSTGQVVWVTDAGGPDALEFAAADGTSATAEPRRVAGGSIGLVEELAAAPSPSRHATAGCTWWTLPPELSPSLPRPATARSPGWPGRPTRPGWRGHIRGKRRCAGCGWRGGPAAPYWMSPTTGSSTPSPSSPPMASTWPSCPAGVSTRSMTPISSTCPSRTAAART